MSRVQFDEKHIYIDGVPTKIMSGAMHYFRIHPEYWRDRLIKLKEMGCNCVETYLAWNLHEKNEREFDFSGWLDFGAYLDLAKGLGLYAIVRPGPYICSELDLGGLPWWLLRYDGIALRTSQPLFLEKITPFLKRACDILAKRMIDVGGNIIFVQVENEYGSYGNDKAYLKYLKDTLQKEGVSCPLITSDGAAEMLLRNGGLPDVMASVNYRKESQEALSCLKGERKGQPGAVMELWNGRAQHWGKPLPLRKLDEVALSVETALEHAELVNLYMFHGGTTFGFMNGMDHPGAIHMTSYDVDAPLDEYGRRTAKYYAEQRVIARVLGKEIRNTAKDTVLFTYGEAETCGTARIDKDQVTGTQNSPVPLSMETCGQGYGYIAYETEICLNGEGDAILLPAANDMAHVYLNGEYVKSVWREDAEREIPLSGKGDARISVFVENLGHCNSGAQISEKKGLLDALTHIYRKDGYICARPTLMGYRIYSIPLADLPASYEDAPKPGAPAFYRYRFYANEAHDTCLYPRGFMRGVVFINGFNLGRHWAVEPSPNKLFLPAPLIKKGWNEIVVFDVLATEKEKCVFLGE